MIGSCGTNNRWLQIEAGQKRAVVVRAGSKVIVRQHRDGSLTLLLDGNALLWHELSQRPVRSEPVVKRRVVTRSVPAADHPWRKASKAAQGR